MGLHLFSRWEIPKVELASHLTGDSLLRHTDILFIDTKAIFVTHAARNPLELVAVSEYAASTIHL